MNLPDMYTVYGDNRVLLAAFVLQTDARAYVESMATSGDWRSFQHISIWFHDQGIYVAERGLTHST